MSERRALCVAVLVIAGIAACSKGAGSAGSDAEAASGAAAAASGAASGAAGSTTAASSDAPREATTRAETMIALRASPPWLPPVGACPADVMPKDLVLTGYAEGRCAGEALTICARNCGGGDPQICFALALELQQNPEQPDELSQRVFELACKLGEAGGCTSRTAGRLKMQNNQVDDCTVRSFRRSCDANDAWACAMLAAALTQGGDRQELSKVAQKACELAADRPPCESAKRVEKALESADQAFIEKQLLGK